MTDSDGDSGARRPRPTRPAGPPTHEREATITMTERSVSHATFTIERRYDAPPGRVFAAWADPDARERWFVFGDAFEECVFDHDFRIGGRERIRFRWPGEPTYRNETVYLDIVPDARIVFAYSIAREDTPITGSLATVELTADGSGTRQVFTEHTAILDGGDQPGYREQGWTSLLDALGTELQRDPVIV